MKKNDLKKLALLGITGALLAGQGTAEAAQGKIDTNQLIARNGCGGKNGCGGHHRPAQAPVQYQSMPIQEGAAAEYNEYIGRDVAVDRNQQQRHITEQELLGRLNPQTRTIYNNMDQEGRELALDLFNNRNFQDPNRAVRAAADQIQNGMRNGMMHRDMMQQRSGMMQDHQDRMSPR